MKNVLDECEKDDKNLLMSIEKLDYFHGFER